MIQDVGDGSFFWAMGVSCCGITISQFFVIWKTDLEKEAETMIKKMEIYQDI